MRAQALSGKVRRSITSSINKTIIIFKVRPMTKKEEKYDQVSLMANRGRI